jgi:putative membrane protein
MKNSKKLQLLFLQLAFISVLTFTISSCNNEAKTEDAKEVADDKNEAKMDVSKNEADANFLVDVAEINQEEINLGKLAQDKGSITDVKELGKMLEQAHTKAMNDLSALALQKSISLPEVKTEDVNEAYKNLNEKKLGKEFDKEYCDRMVDGHKKAIEKFEKAANDSVDPDIKAMATNMLPELNKHLEMAQKCQKKCESLN